MARRAIDKPRMAIVAITVLVVGVAIAALVVAAQESDTLDPTLALATLETCGADGAAGTVENNADHSATPVVEVEFSDPVTGTFIHKGSVTSPGMDPGESRPWQIEYRPDLYDTDVTEPSCAVSVPSLFRFES